MSRILVTGANGYIGRNVVKVLLDLGADVMAIDYKCDYIDCRAKHLDIDIFDESKYTFESLGSPDVCIHLAWKDGFVHNSLSHLEYLPKHYSFIKNLVNNKIKKVVIMGSMHEVGYFEGSIDETVPNNPSSLYGISKNALRQAVQALSNSNNVVFQWIRGYYIYGDDRFNNSVFTKILQKCDAGEATFPFNSGKNKYDFIKIDDLALEIALVALQTKVDGIINCCTGKPVALKDKVEEFIKEKSLDISLDYGAFPDRIYDSPIIYGSSKKILDVLNNAKNTMNEDYNLKVEKLLSLMEG